MKNSFGLFLLLLFGSSAFAQTAPPFYLQNGRGVTRVGSATIGVQTFAAIAADSPGSKDVPLRRTRIEFFPDVSVNVNLDRLEIQGPVTAWSGKVEGIDISSATFVLAANRLTGSVNLGNGKVYELRTADDGSQWSVEIDQSSFPKDEGDVPAPSHNLPAAAFPAGTASDAAVAADDGSVIDVLVLYTPAARLNAGGTTQIQLQIQLGIAETNTAYSNSNIVQRVRLAGSQEINYAEASAGISTDLARMANLGDSFIDEVGALRDGYGADLVSLWVDTSEAICGIGYVLTSPSASASALAPYGYSVVERGCATGNYTFGHEMGHNMGATHALDDLSNGNAPTGAYAYSHGYKQTTGNDRFRTVMAYDCSPTCARIQNFSNPSVTRPGSGLATGADGTADNAQTLNNTRNIVANFRASVAGNSGGPTDTTAPLLTITTQSQAVSISTIAIIGTATDSARGNNGISSVTVNGARAGNDTATGANTATWTRNVTLNPGVNVITVVARDASLNLNSTSSTISITYTPTVTSTSATASIYHVFPRVADGHLGDGTSYKTTLMITNPSSTAASNCTVQLRGVTLPGIAPSYNLAASGWVIATTNGTGPFQGGYASLSCTAPVEAQMLYSFYRANGTKASEATVFSSPPAPSVRLIADEREGASLGIAIANDTDTSVTYTISVSNQPTTGNVTVAARSSTAAFLSQFLPSLAAGNVGTVTITASGNGTASAIGLRFTGEAFTTMPQSLANTVGSTASTYHVFPRMADGRFDDGSYYRTTRIYMNPSGTDSAICTTLLRGLTTDDRDTFVGSLSPGSAIVSPTNGTQAFQGGYATMDCTASVEAEFLYSFYGGDGVKRSEATVFSSPPAQVVQVLVDTREGAQVGLAIANDSDQTNTYTITAYDAAGATVASASQQVAARISIARFVNEFIPSLPANYYGPVVVSGTGTASILGLRYTGPVFTTIPQTIRVAANAVTSPLTVVRAFTSDTSNTESNAFLAGQTVRLKMTRSNTSSSALSASARYKVSGPSGVAADSTIPITAAVGINTAYVELAIPSNAAAGAYTFEASVTFNGVTSTQSSTFTVSVDPNAGNTSVTVSKAFVSDTSDVEGTTYTLGQTIRLKMVRVNPSSSTIVVSARYRVTGPAGYTLTDATISPANAAAGTNIYYTEVVIPANAPTGIYTFEASVTYNGTTSTQSSTFTVQ